jgi:hypothetical protein
MSYKVAIISSTGSQEQKDLGKMISHLEKVLSGVENSELESITLTPTRQICWENYDYVVFCGYDYITFSYLYQCLAEKNPPLITCYDEPGKSLESEFNNIFFRGVDCGRIPASSLSAIEYSWSYKDILSKVSQFSRNSVEPEKSTRANPRPGSRNSRARQVENTGKAQTSKGDAPDKDGDIPGE